MIYEDKIMVSKEEFAQLLDGRTYDNEITEKEEKIAKKSELYVIFGSSDNVVCIKGLVDVEQDFYGAKDKVYFHKTELVELDYDRFDDLDEQLKWLKKYGIEKTDMRTISPVYGNKKSEWIFKTNIPHSTFKVYEEGNVFCTGMVFSKYDLLSQKI